MFPDSIIFCVCFDGIAVPAAEAGLQEGIKTGENSHSELKTTRNVNLSVAELCSLGSAYLLLESLCYLNSHSSVFSTAELGMCRVYVGIEKTKTVNHWFI